ncbi:MAG TPA: hypothetical protein VGF55_21490 [Gemmataceae bacterium]|jgi:hypothetical protein
MPDTHADRKSAVNIPQTIRIADTISTASRGVAAAVWAAGGRGGPMPPAELLELVRQMRDERGRLADTAAHQLLTEVACALEWAAGPAVRGELSRRVEALRDERRREPNQLLALLLAEVAATLGTEPATAARGFCEFCGSAGSGCAVCGSE